MRPKTGRFTWLKNGETKQVESFGEFRIVSDVGILISRRWFSFEFDQMISIIAAMTPNQKIFQHKNGGKNDS